MLPITFEKITVPYGNEELFDWKSRNPKTVPQFALNWNDPGVSNGYGFGEWKAEQHFRQQGFYVINNEFNLLSKHSKFERYNQIIKLMIHEPGLNLFLDAVQRLTSQGYSIENPDLFVYNLHTSFFAEVKKEKDVLREPQLRFMLLARLLLKTESKLVYMSDTDSSISYEIITEKVALPNDVLEMLSNVQS
ncbi:hypothetical protein [Parageobacillus thermoglucosidasius]|uniref:hypothetical protein n=1 Tax=Parageobacillus thermoglucosidasius TaxID=1426 RepID=UPI000B575152|nr:hypothetical protein [Parageobacillus thermoglucosidasius]MBY6270165.1 hypothetical protein [Parageobacillus thermoglucosidasius]OUM91253.1 MAG: hypothetical protein BAA00_16245 [Parageobacillus thermoglucosidasius]